MRLHLKVLERFPDVVFLPGFWVAYGMALEPSAFGVGIAQRPDAPPSIRHLDLPPEDWGRFRLPDPEQDGLMPLALRRLELLEKGELPEPHRIRFAAARGPLALAAHVVGTTAFLAYGVGQLSDSIWKAQPWSSTIKNAFDGLVYGLVTAGVFGWLWPR